MYELLLIFSLSYLFLSRKKRKRKPRGLDEELKELITQSTDATSIGLDIKRYLLNTINENNHDREKFTDAQLAEAQRILDRAGPSAFYWMSDIAAQFAILAAAQANGIPTNVGEKLGSEATAEAIVDVVVQP